jgi:putative ABC transport system substrate-binding protein
MRRRELLAIAGAAAARAAAASPALAQAPQPQRIAFVHSGIPTRQLTETSETFWVRRFFAALRALGYAEGGNLAVERYSAEGRPERFAALARDVVARRPAVIVVNQNSLVRAFRAATDTIPIVAIVGDPVGSGLVRSLAHPGGNITGVSVDAGIEFYGKRLQILKEAVPTIKTVGYLGLTSDWNGAVGRTIREAGQGLQISLTSLAPPEAIPAHLRDVFAEAARRPIDGLVVSSAGNFLAHRELIVELAREYRVSAMYPYRDYVQAGGLIAYAPELGDLAQRLAEDVDKILRGTKPGEIPIYQASKFELVINLNTAKALGLTVPPHFLARADEVIE